jgi:hypothetical protein
MRLHSFGGLLMAMGELITWPMDPRTTNDARKPASKTTSYEDAILDGVSIEQAVTIRSC